MPHGSPRFVHGKILHNTGSGIFYRMEVAIPERIDFVPGQFAMVSGWPGNDPLLPRPLAIFRSGGVRGKGFVARGWRRVWIQGARPEGPGGVVETTLRSPTERNAVDMPVSAAVAEGW